MTSRCTRPLTGEALSIHGLASRDQAHEQGRCSQVLTSQNPPRTLVRPAAPRAEENAPR